MYLDPSKKYIGSPGTQTFHGSISAIGHVTRLTWHLTSASELLFELGVVHKLRNHGWGRSPQMITDYIGGVWPNDYNIT